MSPIRIGIIGAGWWAVENHIPVLQSIPNVEVTSICGSERNQLEKLQEEFGINFATENHAELLSGPNIDGVIVSSPHNFHHTHAVAALHRGLPVLCEKPMALTSSDATDLVKLVEDKNATFLIPYGWNYTELAKLAKNAVEAGEIGDVEHVLCHMASPARDLLSGTGSSVAQHSLLKPAQGTWSDRSRGGGFAHGQLTHALALLLWITDMQASQILTLTRESRTGVDLTVAMSCQFSNGATGMIGGTGTAPPDSRFQVDIRIFGTKGMLLLDIERPRLEVYRDDGKCFCPRIDHPPGQYACVEPLKVFIRLLQKELAENRSPVSLGKRVVDILDAGLRSAASRKVEFVG